MIIEGVRSFIKKLTATDSGRFGIKDFYTMNTPLHRATALRCALCALLLLVSLVASTNALADNDAMAMPTAKPAANSATQPPAEAVHALLSMAGDRQATLDTTAIAPLLDYVISGQGDGMELPPLDGASGAMIRETLNSPLSRILQYAYNPDIPAHLIFPSVVRISGWEPGSDILSHPGLWTELETLDAPIILHGREFEEITPDVSSGGYYSYSLDRTLVLMKYQDRNVLLSIAKQNGLSDIGKKGVVLDDSTWQYFYSGIEGLTKGGIGWMDTYLYGSWSVSAFIEEPGQPGRTANAVFKWLRAGWAKLNVVRPKHILAGCRRYSTAFKTVINSENLPTADAIADKVREISALPEQEIDKRIREYAAALEQTYGSHPDLSSSTFEDIVRSSAYAESLSRTERIGILLLEYLKSHLGTLSLLRG